ncbi:uncharacterized protein LOC120650782 isoform X2 [Panicum virgatum]|uniref:uncharacterized protein LOC120650782 isoform X2 n=1 Tax=Panicum virgatum TaxID=38727 RepID=UPI0019D584B1|nr:uncharacterized protein LOC120650782 isoform X2 [Panicum virgatum]
MCISTLGHADWKPLQFLCFAYFYIILEKLKATEPAIAPIYNVFGSLLTIGCHVVMQDFQSFAIQNLTTGVVAKNIAELPAAQLLQLQDSEYGEDEGQGIHMVRRVLRSLGLVLGSILAASLGYTGLANFSQFLGQ